MAETAPSMDFMLCGQTPFASSAPPRAPSPAMKLMYCNGETKPMLVPVQPLLALGPLSGDRPASGRKSGRRRRKKKPQSRPENEVNKPAGVMDTLKQRVAKVGRPPTSSTTGSVQPELQRENSLSNVDGGLSTKKASDNGRSSSRTRGGDRRRKESPWAVATSDLLKTAPAVMTKPAQLSARPEKPPPPTADRALQKDGSEPVTKKGFVETMKQEIALSGVVEALKPKLKPKKVPFWAQHEVKRPPLTQEAIVAAAEKAEAERIRAMQRIEDFRRAEQQHKANLIHIQEERRRGKQDERLAVAREKERRRVEVYALNRLMCLSEEARVEQYRIKMAAKVTDSTVSLSSPVKAA
eukprot:8781411-Pyramimonas_sp.AAC.1